MLAAEEIAKPKEKIQNKGKFRNKRSVMKIWKLRIGYEIFRSQSAKSARSLLRKSFGN